ncbi:Dabb family protein [Mucilaginibacter sp.]|uniref:Dabb family protein n=1 Tax=Mucilaginibacter sp. TaxID=1882438 RepID=UPI003D11E612
MIAHHVLFWLKAETTTDQHQAFAGGLQTLKDIEVVKTIHIGTPAPIERAVVDTSYTFSLVLFFDDLAAHDVYQVHPIHKAFLDSFRQFFDKVIIYDAQ